MLTRRVTIARSGSATQTNLYGVFLLNAVLLVVDWNNWILDNSFGFILGIPLAVLGALLVLWGIVTLGIQNTSGMKDRFVTSGPYALSRNPQYLGDMALFLGLSVIANSRYLLIAHLLLIVVFVVAPLAEEPWLEEQCLWKIFVRNDRYGR